MADTAPTNRGGSDSAPMPALAEIGLDHFAPYLLNRIAARWNADLQVRLREHDLTTIQMRTLAVLSVFPSATVNELAVYTVTEQSTMSRALDGLVREKLVRRQNRPGDMRVREAHLTEAGHDVFRRFWPTMYAEYQRMFEGIDQKEWQAFVETLRKVLINIRRNEL